MDLHGRLNRCIGDTLGQDPRAALIAYRQLADEYMPWLETRVVALAKRRKWTYVPGDASVYSRERRGTTTTVPSSSW